MHRWAKKWLPLKKDTIWSNSTPGVLFRYPFFWVNWEKGEPKVCVACIQMRYILPRARELGSPAKPPQPVSTSLQWIQILCGVSFRQISQEWLVKSTRGLQGWVRNWTRIQWIHKSWHNVLNPIKESKNHSDFDVFVYNHLFTLVLQDPLYKDKSWHECQL